MKTIKLFSFFALSALIFSSCSSDDDGAPQVINEEEVITTMTVTLTSNGTTKTMKITDSDGDGPLDPVLKVDALDANTTYNGTIEFLNELEDPADNITLEVAEEDDEHQVFYVPSPELQATIVYNDSDANGDPVGLDFTLTTGDASSGTLNVKLIHLPAKDAAGVSEGNPANAGGETDVEAFFDVDIL